MKIRERLGGGGRDMAAYEIRAIAAPATTAIIRSAERRSPTLNGMRCSGHIWGTRLGSQRRPRRSSTVVTISTSNCVTPRSGAESKMKLMQVARPGPPVRISAASHRYFACQATQMAQEPPNNQDLGKD